MYLRCINFCLEVMGILYPARLKALKVVLLQKRQIRPKAVQRSRMMRHREVRGIRKIIPIIHPEPVQQEVPTEQRVEALTEPDIPEEHRREAERPEVQAALPQELREQPEEQKGQQQEVERPEIMQAALREPLDRQKERNK